MKLSERLDKVLEMVNEIRVEQAEQRIMHEINTKDLQEHMRRTSLNEKQIELTQSLIDSNKALLERDLASLEQRVNGKVDSITSKASIIWLVLTVIGSGIIAIAQLLSTFKLI